MDFREHYYTSEDGLRLYYREYGRGDRTVVCLPGLTRNSKDFHEVASHLSVNYRVIGPDLRGRGQSEWDPNRKNYNIAVYVADIRRLMSEAGTGQAILIGTSLGALISMNLAYQCSRLLRAVILNDLGPEVDPVGYDRILASVGQHTEVNSWQEAAEYCRERYGLIFPEKPLEFWMAFARKSYREGENGVPELDLDPKIADAVRFTARAARVLGILKSMRLLHKVRGIPLDQWDAFRAITMPCLVLRGETSDILSEEIVDRMKVVKPDLVRVTIPRRGHAPFLDEPEAVSAIDAFIGGLA